jgi:hypothetical protein
MGGGRAWLNPPGNCLHFCAKSAYAIQYVYAVREAALRGNVFAMQTYAQLLWDGQLAKRNRAAAVAWFREAAIRGDKHSMEMLGHAFAKGQGVPRDAVQSAYWLERATSVDPVTSVP